MVIHAFDRQTDTFLIASPRWHSMQHGKKYIQQNSLVTVEYVIVLRVRARIH